MKKNILINFKRFEVHNKKGGVCKNPNPIEWLQNTLSEIINLKWGCHPEINLTIFVPEILLIPAVEQLKKHPENTICNLSIGTQSCHREDVIVGGNFGAFTSHSIATTQAVLGSKANIIGHCEERRDIVHSISQYCQTTPHTDLVVNSANTVSSTIISEKITCSLANGMKVALCVGETAEERGQGTEEEQLACAKEILKNQILTSLGNIDSRIVKKDIILAYEPVWAIGPGKTPPGKDYISFISSYIKDVVKDAFNIEVQVVYGGGLKADNAAMLAEIDTIDGGLIALTNFTPPISFQSDELNRILGIYLSSVK